MELKSETKDFLKKAHFELPIVGIVVFFCKKFRRINCLKPNLKWMLYFKN